jgi:hypothetical protein
MIFPDFCASVGYSRLDGQMVTAFSSFRLHPFPAKKSGTDTTNYV